MLVYEKRMVHAEEEEFVMAAKAAAFTLFCAMITRKFTPAARKQLVQQTFLAVPMLAVAAKFFLCVYVEDDVNK